MIERLQTIQNEYGTEVCIRGAFQPRWVLHTDIKTISTVVEKEGETITNVTTYIGIEESNHVQGKRDLHYSDTTTFINKGETQ
jgi:hypothetical protein